MMPSDVGREREINTSGREAKAPAMSQEKHRAADDRYQAALKYSMLLNGGETEENLHKAKLGYSARVDSEARLNRYQALLRQKEKERVDPSQVSHPSNTGKFRDLSAPSLPSLLRNDLTFQELNSIVSETGHNLLKKQEMYNDDEFSVFKRIKALSESIKDLFDTISALNGSISEFRQSFREAQIEHRIRHNYYKENESNLEKIYNTNEDNILRILKDDAIYYNDKIEKIMFMRKKQETITDNKHSKKIDILNETIGKLSTIERELEVTFMRLHDERSGVTSAQSNQEASPS